MIVKTKFDLGQEVYKISFHTKSIRVTCKTCLGKGIVILKKEEFSCPKCNRLGFKNQTEPQEWRVSGPYRIGNVKTNLFEKYINKNEILYMMDETGIGTGTIHREEHLMSSRKAAEKAAREKNNERHVANEH